MSIITIEQQITGLRAELARSSLTKRERVDALIELDWLKERLRIGRPATVSRSPSAKIAEN